MAVLPQTPAPLRELGGIAGISHLAGWSTSLLLEAVVTSSTLVPQHQKTDLCSDWLISFTSVALVHGSFSSPGTPQAMQASVSCGLSLVGELLLLYTLLALSQPRLNPTENCPLPPA